MRINANVVSLQNSEAVVGSKSRNRCQPACAPVVSYPTFPTCSSTTVYETVCGSKSRRNQCNTGCSPAYYPMPQAPICQAPVQAPIQAPFQGACQQVRKGAAQQFPVLPPFQK